jgi:hypothetical protein
MVKVMVKVMVMVRVMVRVKVKVKLNYLLFFIGKSPILMSRSEKIKWKQYPKR